MLINAAARLISEVGPTALSARRLAAETGTSTMAIYTYFGSMSALVREIAHEGFDRLQRLFDLVEPTEDPVEDMSVLGRVYRYNAVSNTHVFAVMFGGSSLAGFSLTEEDRQYGRYTLGAVVECAARCITSARFRPDDAVLSAHRMWLGVHGTVSLELGGYLVEPYDADSLFESQLTGLMIGDGDDPERANESVARSRRRFTEVFALTDSH
jgi:AcrR family transcriptional regulator